MNASASPLEPDTDNSPNLDKSIPHAQNLDKSEPDNQKASPHCSLETTGRETTSIIQPDNELDEIIAKVSLNSARGYTKVGLKQALERLLQRREDLARASELEMFKKIPLTKMSKEVSAHISRRYKIIEAHKEPKQ